MPHGLGVTKSNVLKEFAITLHAFSLHTLHTTIISFCKLAFNPWKQLFLKIKKCYLIFSFFLFVYWFISLNKTRSQTTLLVSKQNATERFLGAKYCFMDLTAFSVKFYSIFCLCICYSSSLKIGLGQVLVPFYKTELKVNLWDFSSWFPLVFIILKLIVFYTLKRIF